MFPGFTAKNVGNARLGHPSFVGNGMLTLAKPPKRADLAHHGFVNSWLSWVKPNRLCNGTLDSPSGFPSSKHGVMLNAIKFTPFSLDLCNSINSDMNIRSSVTLLFYYRSPSAIAWFVMSVGIDAIKRMLRRWTFSHVSKKHSKIITPLRRHLDTSAAISLVIFICFAFAAFLGLPPSLVFWGGFIVALTAVLEIILITLCATHNFFLSTNELTEG